MPTTTKFPKTMTPVRVDRGLFDKVSSLVERYHGKQNSGNGYVIRDAIDLAMKSDVDWAWLSNGQLADDATENLQAKLTDAQDAWLSKMKEQYDVTNAYIVRACLANFFKSLEEKEKEVVNV